MTVRFRVRHLTVLLSLLLVVCAGLFAVHEQQIRAAREAVERLRAERVAQQDRLDAMERQAQTLQKEYLESQRSIDRIERSLGTPRAVVIKTSAISPVVVLAADRDVRLASLQTRLAQTNALADRLVRRVLVMHRLAQITRARMLAAIPSLNPVNGGINAAFGWRTDPFPEFHKGLDLAADYGAPVHAAAAGVVASAGWEGGFGIKVDLDHGNGYHTWYCHLSRLSVTVGQRVARDQVIALVGSTGESTGPHLHYQVMKGGVAIDPMPYLNGIPPRVLASLPVSPDVH